MDNVIPPLPPAHDDGATERTKPKRPWSKPWVRIINQRMALVESGDILHVEIDETPNYRPS